MNNSSSITEKGSNSPSGTISVTLSNSCGTTTYTKDVINDPWSSYTGTCSNAYTEGQFLFSWNGENVNAHKCGAKNYVTTSSGSSGGLKPRHWLEATNYAQANYFEEDDPRPTGCGGGSCSSLIPSLSASSPNVPST